MSFSPWLGTLRSRASPEFGSCPRTYDNSDFDDFPNHRSGLQKWKGAALTLNKNPTDIISNERCI